MSFFSRSFFTLAAGLLWSSSPAAPEPMAGYLMGYTTESPKGGGNSWNLKLATSEDGLDWMPLNQNEPVLVSPIGQKGIRDPFFLRKQDGGFVVLATDQSGAKRVVTQNVFVCDTTDFITFDDPRLLKLHDTPMHTFAPEVFFDPGRNEYGIIWSGDIDRNRIYVNHTRDFVNVSPFQVYFDPGQDARDATLIDAPEQGGHFLYYRDTLANRLHGTYAPTLAPGGFSRNPHSRPPGEFNTEAPVLVKSLHEKRWFLYGDSNNPMKGEFYAWQTDDIHRGNWQPINKRDYNPPLDARHATVIPITRTEMDRLVAHWGRPKWNRLKPWNYPDFFLRHELFLGRISPYPIDPWLDSRWKLIPGLADPKAVSFEAVNYPGYYLRSVAEHLMLRKDDGTPAFKTKATFVKVPGLAEGSWSSFHSLSSPDLYLRHANYHLRLEAVVTPTDKDDATFRIVY